MTTSTAPRNAHEHELYVELLAIYRASPAAAQVLLDRLRDATEDGTDQGELLHAVRAERARLRARH